MDNQSFRTWFIMDALLGQYVQFTGYNADVYSRNKFRKRVEGVGICLEWFENNRALIELTNLDGDRVEKPPMLFVALETIRIYPAKVGDLVRCKAVYNVLGKVVKIVDKNIFVQINSQTKKGTAYEYCASSFKEFNEYFELLDKPINLQELKAIVEQS